jgi:hypothetical protein
VASTAQRSTLRGRNNSTRMPLVSQKPGERPGIIPKVNMGTIDVVASQPENTSWNYRIVAVVILIVAYYLRKRSLRNGAKNKLRKARDSIDLSTPTSVVSVNENGLEMSYATPMRRQMPTLRGLPTTAGGVKSNSIMSKSVIENLVQDLPTRHSISDWSLLYSSSRDGYSLRRCVEAARKRGPGLLICQDTKNYLFGVFLSETLEKRDGYYGTGETFVVKLHPEYKVYYATGSNTEYICCETDYLGFGGGGKFALHLDTNFERGSSEPSPTFDNSCLASAPNFKIVNVELWSFVVPY